MFIRFSQLSFCLHSRCLLYFLFRQKVCNNLRNFQQQNIIKVNRKLWKYVIIKLLLDRCQKIRKIKYKLTRVKFRAKWFAVFVGFGRKGRSGGRKKLGKRSLKEKLRRKTRNTKKVKKKIQIFFNSTNFMWFAFEETCIPDKQDTSLSSIFFKINCDYFL